MRRILHRVVIEGPVRVMPTGERPQLLKFTNLSMGGLFVKTLAPLKVGSVVDLELRVLRVPFKATAKVAWIRTFDGEPDKWGMGLEFRKLSTVQQKVLYGQLMEAAERAARMTFADLEPRPRGQNPPY